jgi:hypothetical protein
MRGSTLMRPPVRIGKSDQSAGSVTRLDVLRTLNQPEQREEPRTSRMQGSHGIAGRRLHPVQATPFAAARTPRRPTEPASWYADEVGGGLHLRMQHANAASVARRDYQAASVRADETFFPTRFGFPIGSASP